MFELLKTLGSFAGLLTAVMFFYDRLVKGRPVAYLLFDNDENKSAYIRLNNPGERAIIVWKVAAHPDVFTFAEDLERRSVIRSVAGTHQPLSWSRRRANVFTCSRS